MIIAALGEHGTYADLSLKWRKHKHGSETQSEIEIDYGAVLMLFVLMKTLTAGLPVSHWAAQLFFRQAATTRQAERFNLENNPKTSSSTIKAHSLLGTMRQIEKKLQCSCCSASRGKLWPERNSAIPAMNE